MEALFAMISKPFQPLVKAVKAVVKWGKSLKELKVLAPERSRQDYIRFGRRYVAKRLVAVICLLLVAGVLYLFIRPPYFIAGWLGWPRTLVEGSKPALAFNGLGKLISEEGDLHYVGQVVKGVYEGKGKLYNTHEVLIYEGDFKKGLPSGTGTQYNGMSQMVYQGEFKDGVYSGQGLAYHSSGKVRYDGAFVGGKMQGAGTKYYVTGQVQYTGEFANDAYAGKGTLYDMNGKVQYDGLFLDGKYEGAGKLFNASGNLLYDGTFAAGEYSGAGKLYGDSGKLLYEGAFLNGTYSGAGTEYYANGVVKFKGEFAAGKYQGDGKLFAESGKPAYTGPFVNGKFEGEGQKFNADGLPLYKGQFKAGLEDGRGERYDQKGELIYKGFFQRGRIFYPGFLGLDPKGVEELLDKATDVTVENDTLKMLYSKYKMQLQLEVSKENEKDSLVTAVEVWNESGLQDIDAIVKGKDVTPPDAADDSAPRPEDGKGTPKGDPAQANQKPILYRQDGNVTVYKVGNAMYYCYYNGDHLLRAMVAPAKSVKDTP